MLGNGLRDLVDSFKQAGHGEVADSWVAHGPNKQIESSHLERIIGSDVLDALVHDRARLWRHTTSARQWLLQGGAAIG
jgi:uncharacterized protein YidB (DUF937 family)